MATDAGTGDVTDRFSLVGGGPFDALLDRFGLIGEDRLPTWRAAVVMALLAWMPPAALAVVATQVPIGDIFKWILGRIF